MREDFSAKLEYGRVGESVIATWLKSRGNMVLPAYQIEQSAGKGPQLFSCEGSFVAPDALVFNQGKVFWVEAKHKTRFAWHRNSREWVTGIDLRHYQEYIQVQCKTQKPVWLMFWHPLDKPSDNDLSHGCPLKCPVGLFGNDLQNLTVTEHHTSTPYDPTNQKFKGHGKSGMVYWGVDSLKRLASVAAIRGLQTTNAYPNRTVSQQEAA